MILHKNNKLFLFAFLIFSFVSPVKAAQLCEAIFTDPQFKTNNLDFDLRSEVKQPDTPRELVEFKTIKAILWSRLERVPTERKQQIEHLLAAVEFFDYTHTAEKIISNFLEGNRAGLDFSRIYDQFIFNEAEAAPYKGFLSARDNFLRKEKPPITAELLLEIHKRIMENGVEGIRPNELGNWRNVQIIGNVVGSFKMTPNEVEIVKKNPYLDFIEHSRQENSSSVDVWKKIKFWGSKQNMVIEMGDTTLVSGQIQYPHVKTKKQSAIDIIKNSHPVLYSEIMLYRKQYGNDNVPVDVSLEKDFTKALVEERFARFKVELASLGKIKIGINERRYIDIVADLQRDLVAIHPVRNGNGRTTRLLMNYLLTKEGLPPVRLVDPFLDIQVSQKDWRENVYRGVLNSAQLQADILFRLSSGLTVEHSPALLYPGLPDSVDIALKQQGKSKVIQNYSNAKVDSKQFSSFFKTLVQAHPELKIELQNNRLRTMSHIADLFVEFYRSKTIRYMHDKDGERLIGLRLVDPDFINLFGVNRSNFCI